jgi:hypothetical protein
MNPIFADMQTSVFEVMSRLAREHNAVNLGQGFPDDPGSARCAAESRDAVINGWNQYPPMMGLPELRMPSQRTIRHWQGLDLDPDREIMVTSGATEALAGALLALIEPGDEVVLFEPMYDAYLPLVRRAGGIPKFVTLKPPHFRLTEEALPPQHSRRAQGLRCSTIRSTPRPRSSPTRILTCWPLLPALRRAGDQRRGLGARGFRRSPAHVDHGAARPARTCRQDLVGRARSSR